MGDDDPATRGPDNETQIDKHTQFWSFRINFLLCGVYWLAINYFPFTWLLARRSPEPDCNILLASVKELKKTFQKVKKLPETMKFLGAYFVFSDGEATVAAGAAVLAVNELDFSGFELAASIRKHEICSEKFHS